MSVKMKIKVTKGILFESRMCSLKIDKRDGKIKHLSDIDLDDLSVEDQQFEVIRHCAIAVAIRELFPFGAIGSQSIMPFYYDRKVGASSAYDIRLPGEAVNFIHQFDRLITVEERLAMPELEFEVNIPDCVIDKLELPDLSEYLKESKTLELV